MNKTLLMAVTALVFLSLCSTALADLEIASFTCNSMSPTVNIEAGDSMVCEAVIRNTDSQSAASVTTVSLYTTGGWADANSYAGSGFSTSISAGGSTTASFSSVTANVPSDSNKFLYLDIDGTSYTEKVIDLTVNSMTFKSISVTSSVSSAASGAEFTVNSYLTAGGSVSDASMTLGLSGGCSLNTGESATKSIGAMSDNVEVSKSWGVTQGGSTCSITVSASGTSSPVTISRSGTTSVESIGGGGDGNGGGGGGSGGGADDGASTYNIGALDTAGASADVSQSDKVKFKLRGVDHQVKILELTNTRVLMEISSDPFNVTFSIGETKKFDLDEDGRTFDVSITLDSINATSQKAKLTFKLITENIPTDPGVIPHGGVCVPNEKKCVGDELHTCRTDGMAWKIEECAHGCDSDNLECKPAPAGPAAGPGEPLEIPLHILAVIIVVVVLAAAAGLYYMKSGKKKARHVLVMAIVLLIAVLLGGVALSPMTGYVISSYDSFADCLAGEGAVLYGASWCGECREQNALFGDDFSSLSYVDCASSSELCVSHGVREIPAWRINGETYGYLTLEELADLTGC